MSSTVNRCQSSLSISNVLRSKEYNPLRPVANTYIIGLYNLLFISH